MLLSGTRITLFLLPNDKLPFPLALEIERKFLVANEGWKAQADKGSLIKQGYLSTTPERNVRVRLKGEKAFITIKGKTTGISKPEFEYEIPKADAKAMMHLCEKPLIEKTRYLVSGPDGKLWELDVFEGDNQGLIIAEIELNAENEVFEIPDWTGKEVTEDTRYYNASLIRIPFSNW